MLFLLPILCALVSEDGVWDKEDTIPSSCRLIPLCMSIIPTIDPITGACIKFNLFSVALTQIEERVWVQCRLYWSNIVGKLLGLMPVYCSALRLLLYCDNSHLRRISRMRHNLLSFGRTRVPQLSVIEGERCNTEQSVKALVCISIH